MRGTEKYNFRLLYVAIVLKNFHKVEKLHTQSIPQMLLVNANKGFTLTCTLHIQNNRYNVRSPQAKDS